ncbi:hypothetical protein AJ87_36740 [Rhizobium yanglingense]|nr:hypothetical protein AJ87_36740 [Rhizobium yanglingense]
MPEREAKGRQLPRPQGAKFYVATDGGIRHQRRFTPEQLIEEIALPVSGPATCRSFSVSSNSGNEPTRPIPRRPRTASQTASLPESEAV